MTPAGFPHSDISGSTPACDSPKLFAANHVLHRLLTPRHSPCALSSLVTNRLGTLKGFRTSGSLRVGKAALHSLEALVETNLNQLNRWHLATFSIAIRRLQGRDQSSSDELWLPLDARFLGRIRCDGSGTSTQDTLSRRRYLLTFQRASGVI